jgi:hypothetical protein
VVPVDRGRVLCDTQGRPQVDQGAVRQLDLLVVVDEAGSGIVALRQLGLLRQLCQRLPLSLRLRVDRGLSCGGLKEIYRAADPVFAWHVTGRVVVVDGVAVYVGAGVGGKEVGADGETVASSSA